MDSRTPCSVDGCERPAKQGGLCWGHAKRRYKSQTVNGLLAPRTKPSTAERLAEAAMAYAEAETDDEYELARENLRKAGAACAYACIADLTRTALATLKASGKKLGPPRKVEPEAALRLVAQTGSVRGAAVMLHVSARTVRRALREGQGHDGRGLESH